MSFQYKYVELDISLSHVLDFLHRILDGAPDDLNHYGASWLMDRADRLSRSIEPPIFLKDWSLRG